MSRSLLYLVSVGADSVWTCNDAGGGSRDAWSVAGGREPGGRGVAGPVVRVPTRATSRSGHLALVLVRAARS